MIYGWTFIFSIWFRQADISYFYLHTAGKLFYFHKDIEVGKKCFFIMSKYYRRMSVKEGLDIETEKSHPQRFVEKIISTKCRLCSQLFVIAKNFCNSCFKITSDMDKFCQMHVIWKDNSQYRVFTSLWRRFAQEIMNKEDL